MYSLKFFSTTLNDGPVDPEESSPIDTVLVNREMIFTNYDVKSYVRIKATSGDSGGDDEILTITNDNRSRWEDKLTDGPVADALLTKIPDLSLEFDQGHRPVYALFHPSCKVVALVPVGLRATVNKILAKVVKRCAFDCHIPSEKFVEDIQVEQLAPSSGEIKMEAFQMFSEDLEEWKPFISGDYIVQDCETKGCKKLVGMGPISVDCDGFNSNLLRTLGVRMENIKAPSRECLGTADKHVMVMAWMSQSNQNSEGDG